MLLVALASACAERPRQEPVPAPDDQGENRAPAAPSPEPSRLPADSLSSAPMAAGKSQRLAVGVGLKNAKHSLPSAPGAETAPTPGAQDPSAAPPVAEQAGFLEKPEEALLERLRSAEISSVLPSGRPLAFDVALAGGGRARFEPERAAAKERWSGQIAAYQLDRALGLSAVPPTVARSLPWSLLQLAAASEADAASIVRDSQGNVRGALTYQPPGKLTAVRLPAGWEQWLSIEPLAATYVSPYQPAAAWSAATKAASQPARDRSRPAEPGSNTTPAAPEPEAPQLPAELSDMILFDYLTLDTERFAGSPASLFARGRRGSLIWLDHGSFSAGPEARELGTRRLMGLSRFRKRTIDALRALDVTAFGARMQPAASRPLLDRKALAGLESRKRAALAHVDKQQRRFGDAVYAW